MMRVSIFFHVSHHVHSLLHPFQPLIHGLHRDQRHAHHGHRGCFCDRAHHDWLGHHALPLGPCVQCPLPCWCCCLMVGGPATTTLFVAAALRVTVRSACTPGAVGYQRLAATAASGPSARSTAAPHNSVFGTGARGSEAESRCGGRCYSHRLHVAHKFARAAREPSSLCNWQTGSRRAHNCLRVQVGACVGGWPAPLLCASSRLHRCSFCRRLSGAGACVGGL